MKRSNNKIKKKSKYPIKVNIFDPGGDLNGWQQSQADAMDSAKKNPAATGVALAQGAMELVQGGMSNAETDTSKADTAIDAVNSFQPSTQSLDALANDYNNLNLASDNWKGSDFSVSTGQGLANMGKTALAGAAAGAVLGPWGAVAGAAAGLIASGAGWIAGASKAKNLAAERNAAAREANYAATQKAMASRDTIQDNITNQFLSNVAARGGFLKHRRKNVFTEGIKDNMINDLLLLNGIHHAYGGNMKFTGDFTNNVIQVNEGGTHEENPYEGVLMGVDSEGTPNLVEEGEVIWNDYVFSNRLKPSKRFKKQFKLVGETFADVAKYIQKESEERPNDPISKRGLETSMQNLIQEHEFVRQKSNNNSDNKFDDGGMKNKKSKSTRNVFNSLTQQLFDRHKYIDRLGYHTVEEGKELESQERLKRELGVPSIIPPRQNILRNLIPSIQGGVNESIIEALEEANQREGYQTGPKKKFDKGSWLRYMPAVGSGLAVISDLAGLTNKPDYSASQEIKDAANNQTSIDTQRIDTSLNLKPLDQNFYYNRHAAQAAANRQAIANNAINSGQAIEGLLAANQNDQMQSAVLARQAAELGNEQAIKKATFDMEKQKANATLGLQEAALRHKQDQLRLQGIQAATTLASKEDATANAGRSANLSNLYTNLGNIGTDILNRQDAKFRISTMASSLPMDQYAKIYGKKAALEEAKSRGFTDDEISALGFAKGGKLRKKRRGGLTF